VMSNCKDTAVREGMRLQFRAEFFNLFNHAQFNNPGGNFNSSLFGYVTSARDPRIGQMSLKFPVVSNLSAVREGQGECSHLLAVANQQDIAGQDRMVPGLALESREPGELRELIRGCSNQGQLTVLRQHQQQVLVGQQNELAVAVTSALPLALPVLEVDACEDAAVEAEGMAFVNDEVVEIRLQPDRRPANFDCPSAGTVRDRNATHAALTGGDQDVAARDQGR